MSDSNYQLDCPKCGEAISITQALEGEIEQKFERQFRARTSKAEAEFKARQEAFEKQRESLDEEIKRRTLLSRQELMGKLREEFQKQSRLELDDLKTQVEDRNRKLEEAQRKELEFRRKARELEEKEKSVDLVIQRKVDEEKTKLATEASARAAEEYRQKVAEKDLQLDGMRKQIEDLKRRSEQGSQQIQGEVRELELETLLRQTFPMDEIEPVGKGQRGGDIIQRVKSATGQVAGTILWETKVTKTWSDGWVDKLKSDQREITAECAVIVSQVLPKTITRMGQQDGVWVCEMGSALGLAQALRAMMNQVHIARSAAVGKGESADRIYEYMTGTQFKQRIESIVEDYQAQQVDLQKEKLQMQKNWARREKQLEQVLNQTVSMYGDLQGLIGSSLPKIAALEFDADDGNEGEKEIPAYGAQSTFQGLT